MATTTIVVAENVKKSLRSEITERRITARIVFQSIALVMAPSMISRFKTNKSRSFRVPSNATSQICQVSRSLQRKHFFFQAFKKKHRPVLSLPMLRDAIHPFLFLLPLHHRRCQIGLILQAGPSN